MKLLADILSKLKKHPAAEPQQQGRVFVLPENDADYFIVKNSYTGSIPQRLEQILDKRALLHSLISKTSHSAHFVIGTPLSEQNIREIEDKASATLPDEYREFLKIIGEGGTGPWCELASRSSALAVDMDCPSDGQLIPSRSFPLAKPEFFEFDDQLGEEAYFEAVDQFWDGNEDGLVRVGNFGCAIFINLIVSGPERGNLWVRDPNIHGVFPITIKEKPDSRVGVLDWFESWLDYQIISLKKDAQ